jgi:protein-S-isoprenylcysteine O-methyltransferase Ste14
VRVVDIVIGAGWVAFWIYWLIAVAALAAYFGYSAVMEERYMAEEFPNSYPDYKRSTKMLIPFVF